MARLFLILTLALAVNGCKRQSPDAPLEIIASEFRGEMDRITSKAKAALAAKDFDALESIAQNYRTNKECFSDGTSKLHCFYDGLSELDEAAPDSEWTRQIEILTQWVKAKPASITPRVVLAEVWSNFAWKGRGHDYSDKVSAAGFKLFAERTKRAHAVLSEAAGLKPRCPAYWSSMQVIALNESWPRVDYEKLFQDAIQKNPGFFEYYDRKMTYLLPRWYGKEGDWEAFAQTAADNLGAEEGDILYARMIWSIASMGMYEHIYRETKISWDRAKRGFELLHKRYPESLAVTSIFCLHAGFNDDKPKMQELFAELHGRVNMAVWQDKDRFIAFRNGAFGK